MNKVIALSVFGYNNEHKDCHSFAAFLRFLNITLRAYNTLFSDWQIYLAIDKQSYAAFPDYFNYLYDNGIIQHRHILERKELCRNMLWRLNPVEWADYTICRDIDSLPTYRERQAVEQWLQNDTLAHSMNDSISHNIALMGGMIGFKKGAIDVSEIDTCGIDYSIKGSDQDYLNKIVYPQVQHSITEHRVLGLPKTFYNKYSYDTIPDVEIPVDKDEHATYFFADKQRIFRCNALVNHIGQGGFHLEKNYNAILNRTYEGACPFWFENANPLLHEKLWHIEKQMPDIFYWTK